MPDLSFMSSPEQDAAYNEAGHAVARYVVYGTTGRVELLDEGDKAGQSEVPPLPDSLLDGTKPRATEPRRPRHRCPPLSAKEPLQREPPLAYLFAVIARRVLVCD
jgi:hypothetical protein